mmetsp:Transcript_8020/g.14052  ORF Transcript_8020/g.14052 Transcript_8020/m.14052 type:complete len:276 (+) Transcript_8020:344-1171(+)
MGTFVFGQFSYEGLGDAAWFAAACIDQPGDLVAPSLIGRPVWPDVVNVTTSPIDADAISADKINFLVDPNTCGTAALSDVSSILGSYAFCDGAPPSGMEGELLLCNRPLNPMVLSCGDKPLLARVASYSDETLKVEHYQSRPEYPFNELMGRYDILGPSTTPPSGFHSFEGGCEVFVGRDITCFGGGIFVALPYGHRCSSGDPGDLSQLTCDMDAKPLECVVTSSLRRPRVMEIHWNLPLSLPMGQLVAMMNMVTNRPQRPLMRKIRKNLSRTMK